MKYYLETNALYSIEKISKVCVTNCYTSIFSLFELVSGINEKNFFKRKNILGKIRNSHINIDYDMPEKIIFDGFNVTKGFDFEEKRVEQINKQIHEILNVDTYKDFIHSDIHNSSNFGIDFFKNLDDLWSKGFIKATTDGNKRIKRILEQENKGLIMNNKVLELRNNKDLIHLFSYEPALSISISIIAFSGFLKNHGIDKPEKEIYESYNGLIDYYIQCISDYCDDKMIKHETPSMNDFSDITHLLYLRNKINLTIVSDDKIFNRYFKGKKVGIEELINELGKKN